MESKYDKIADAFYFTFKKGKVKNTVQLSDRMNADLDSVGNVLGIELLNASTQLDVATMLKTSTIPFSIVANENV